MIFASGLRWRESRSTTVKRYWAIRRALKIIVVLRMKSRAEQGQILPTEGLIRADM